MADNGYAARHEADGSWSVIDVFKGEPITFKGHLQTNLSEEEANEAIVQLCRKYMERHHEGGDGRLP
ncbi:MULTISPECIES: hypothetical protein [unclassified Ochrobactrum]|uniref:hypothetical protein n=1 Tax=unclassified Ochrobactrum TaxID=239106 RepID=UPI0030A709D2